MARFTTQQVQPALDTLKRIIGTPAANWTLHYYAAGGGYQVQDSVTHDTPLGPWRANAEQMYYRLHTAQDAALFAKSAAENACKETEKAYFDALEKS